MIFYEYEEKQYHMKYYNSLFF